MSYVRCPNSAPQQVHHVLVGPVDKLGCNRIVRTVVSFDETSFRCEHFLKCKIVTPFFVLFDCDCKYTFTRNDPLMV